MVNICCVTGCQNESYPGSRFSFHEFPNKEDLRLQWENAVPGKISKWSVVGNAHFKYEDFIPGYTRRMLKPDAVPSIFPKVVPCEKRVHVLSNICIEEGPAPKTIKLQESVTKETITEEKTTSENVCTQTAAAVITASARKIKLRRNVKVQQQRLKRRKTTIDNLN